MDDIISRQAAIGALERAKQNIQHNIKRAIANAICEILDEIENGVKQLPSAQPKRGKWQYNGKHGTFKIYTCDKCGWNSEAEFNFCPNCGAKMEVTS